MAISPMMKQYLLTKEEYPDCILFYRLGDFYEMFFQDAIEMSSVLDITLTGRDCGLEERAPMCGIPYHAASSYIEKLIREGYKVAICEQLTEPQKGVKIVDRGVVKVITPGTVIEENMLEEKRNNYISSVYINDNKLGVSYADISTGDFFVYFYEGDDYLHKLNDILVRITPSELLANEKTKENILSLPCFKLPEIAKPSLYYSWSYEYESADITLKKQFSDNYINIFDLGKNKEIISSSGSLIEYMKETQKRNLGHINKIRVIANNDYMVLDINTRRNLELTETIRERKKKGSLLSLLDNTSTSMGARMFRSWVEEPLNNLQEINNRLDSVEELVNNLILRDQIIKDLKNINDIERISGRIAYGNFNPRDAMALLNSLKQLPEVKNKLSKFTSIKLKNFYDTFEDFSEIIELLSSSIEDNPPALLKDGGFIKRGYNIGLDEYKLASTDGKKWILQLEAKEREATGIKNLKIGFNKVFGFYIEVNKSQIDLVPFRYQRKQTVANNERFITEDLKIIEEKILNAEEESIKLEQKLFQEIRDILNCEIVKFQKISKIISEIDSLCSFATVAIKNNYSKPKINRKVDSIKIFEGRHPVVESLLKGESFISNDTYLNSSTDKSMIITGPNMAGKSTYMRQVALITLMAHIGSFVPAKSAEIPLTDRIFTRVGASDDVAFGQSTFMVEMSEVAYILNNVTDNSLVILDEIGRGTSTFDGLSIAWAVMEHISNNLNTKTLFSTHYHELTALEGFLTGVKNYKITVKEINDDVIFLRKIARGGANKSFGIAVARLAGLPELVIERAKEISDNLEKTELKREIANKNLSSQENFKKLTKSYTDVIGILNDIDINKIAPMNAFEILNDLIEKVKRK